LRGPHQVIFPKDLASPEGVDLLTPDVRRLRFRMLGLAWLDQATGQRHWLARVQSCAGVIVPPNQVVWEDALDNVWASVRYTYTSAGLEQDLILHEPVRVPEECDERLGVLQVITEFFDPPVAEVRSGGTGVLDDSWISFGAMQMVLGRAFSVGDDLQAEPAASVPIAKRWEMQGNRALLYESVEFIAVREELESLRDTKAGSRPAAGTRDAVVDVAGTDAMPMVAQVSTPRGLVLDFLTVQSAPTFVFQTDQTYRISSAVWISSSTTFQPGAVLKFTSQPTGGSLMVSGSITTPGSLFPRCVFTHVDDNSIGEPIGLGIPSSRYPNALTVYDPSGYGYPPGLYRLEFRYANCAVSVYWPYSTPSLYTCIWRDCNVGVSAYYSHVGLYHLFMCDVVTLTHNSGGGSTFTINPPILTDCTSTHAPQITTQPVNRTVSVGGTAPFTVVATGYGLTYQWYFENARIPGAISSAYLRTGAQHAHAGRYHVVVANDMGSVKSSTAILTVTGPPQIQVQPRSQTLPDNTVARFSVGAAGNPTLYQWYQRVPGGNPVALVNGSRVSGATSFELTLNPCLRTEDNGSEFWAVVSNNYGGTESAHAVLTVTPGCQDRVYTSTADFESNGILINLNTAEAGKIRLNATPKPLPFVNMSCSGRGTLARIDANTGRLVGEYRTAPAAELSNPSRTGVDRFGNAWVGNRGDSDTITCIGVVIGGVRGRKEGGQFIPDAAGEYLKPPFIYNTCPDRNGDGLIRTWSDQPAGYPLSWANEQGDRDEAILHYVRTGISAIRSVAVTVNNDVWAGALGNGFVKVKGTTGVPIPSTRFNLGGRGGYGAVVDGNDVLWSGERLVPSLVRYSGPDCTETTCVLF
jgi:hypothetical protein